MGGKIAAMLVEGFDARTEFGAVSQLSIAVAFEAFGLRILLLWDANPNTGKALQ